MGGAHPTEEAEACFLKAIEIARRWRKSTSKQRWLICVSTLLPFSTFSNRSHDITEWKDRLCLLLFPCPRCIRFIP